MHVTGKMRAFRPAGDERVCGNCRFYAAANSQAGECRRSSPDMGEDTRRAIWPVLTSDAWCGDFDVRLVPVED